MQLKNRQPKKNMVTGLWELKKTINSKHSWKSSQLRGENESEVAQSYPTLCDPVDCSPPGSSVHGILQARLLEWFAISSSILHVFRPAASLCRGRPFPSLPVWLKIPSLSSSSFIILHNTYYHSTLYFSLVYGSHSRFFFPILFTIVNLDHA